MWAFLRCCGMINAMSSLMIGQYSVFDQALSIIDVHVTRTCITQCVVAIHNGETMWVITHKTLSVGSLKIECLISCTTQKKNDVTTWKHFSHFWPFDGNLRSFWRHNDVIIASCARWGVTDRFPFSLTAPEFNEKAFLTLQWRHNGHDDVSNHQPHDCLLNR